jgi:hypothetical protein
MSQNHSVSGLYPSSNIVKIKKYNTDFRRGEGDTQNLILITVQHVSYSLQPYKYLRPGCFEGNNRNICYKKIHSYQNAVF